MHNVSVLPGSLPSVALSLPDTTKIEQSKIICNMFVNTVLRQCSTVIQAETRQWLPR